MPRYGAGGPTNGPDLRGGDPVLSVGHAGASGYLAAMALNILVASIATVRYYRAGYFYWSALWPFAIGSKPLSFVGGAIILPGYLHKPAVGIVLPRSRGLRSKSS